MIMIIIEIAVSQSIESPSYILKFSESLLSTGHQENISDQCALLALDVERGINNQIVI